MDGPDHSPQWCRRSARAAPVVMPDFVGTCDLLAVSDPVVPHRMVVSDAVMVPHRLVSTGSVSVMGDSMVANTLVMSSCMNRTVVASTRAWPKARKRRRRRRHVGRRRRPLLGSSL